MDNLKCKHGVLALCDQCEIERLKQQRDKAEAALTDMTSDRDSWRVELEDRVTELTTALRELAEARRQVEVMTATMEQVCQYFNEHCMTGMAQDIAAGRSIGYALAEARKGATA